MEIRYDTILVISGWVRLYNVYSYTRARVIFFFFLFWWLFVYNRQQVIKLEPIFVSLKIIDTRAKIKI